MAMFRNGPGSPYPTGSNPVSNAVADLDGDGHLDLLTTNYISDNVSVLFGDGNGGFTAGTPVPVTNGPREVKTGDLDGDGDIDALVTNYSGGNVSVLLNDGAGSFTTSSIPVGTIPRGLGIGDLDGDGDLDFVAVNYGSDNLTVMLGNGDGTFTQAAGSPLATGGSDPVALVLVDLDGDLHLDIAVTNNDNNNVAILLNNGSAGFTAAPPAATGNAPRGIATGDFDGDGDADLVVANFLGNSLSILLNDGSGNFTASAPLATGNNPYAVAVGDLDGDGDLDIAVNNSGSATVSVFINNGSASFMAAAGSPFAVGVGGGGVAFGDFDEDGDLDISTTNFNANSISILLNTAATYSVTAGVVTEATAPDAGGELVFTVSRTATSEAEDVTYALGGTATSGVDYVAPTGTVSFAAGQSTGEIRISIVLDAETEVDETIVVTLTGVSGDGIISSTAGSATGTIDDDDTPPDGINDPAVFGGNLTGRVVEAGIDGPGRPTARGTATSADADGPQNTFQPIAAGSASLLGYGTVQMAFNGRWIYHLDNDNPKVDGLKVGETLTDIFTITAADGSTGAVTITIVGADDIRDIVIGGTPGNDELSGTSGNDVFAPLEGDDDIFGGDGDDAVILPGAADGYVFVQLADGRTGVLDIDPSDGDQGADVLDGIEFIRFGGVDAADTPIAGLIDMEQPVWTLEHADVALVAAVWQLFMGSLPSAEGFGYLILSDANPTDLNDPYYAPFNAENTYLNFATNYATGNPAGAAWFEWEFGALSYEEAVEKAFDLIITADALTEAGGDPAASKQFFLDAEDYFAQVAAERIVPGGVDADDATKMALLSSVLYEAVRADVGPYAEAVNDFADEVARVGTSNDFLGDLLAA
ncbi:MAG: FG-GAP-like repeat-containing protein [Rhizobiaceae bacterium]